MTQFTDAYMRRQVSLSQSMMTFDFHWLGFVNMNTRIMYMTWINMIELKSQGNSITTINHFNRLDGLCIAMAFIDDVVKVQSLKLSGIAFQEL